MRTSCFRFGFGLLLLAGTAAFSACNKTNVGPCAGHSSHASGSCHPSTASDSTTTNTKSS